MPPVPSGTRWLLACGLVAAIATVATGLAQTSPASSVSSASPASPSSPAVSNSAALYNANCASCHGNGGRGDGPAASGQRPAPRDFTKGVYKFRTTASGSLPSDDDLVRAIAIGLPGTSMPGWKNRLTDAQIAELAAYLKTMSPRFAHEQPSTVTPTAAVPTSPASIEQGRKAYNDLACGACHGDTGTTSGAMAVILKDDWGQDVKAADLTEPWMFRGGSSAADVYLRLKTGINGTPMPAMADTAKDADLWNIANYVVSIGRKPTWKMNAEELKAQYERERKDAAANPAERGRYLAASLGCARCHTPIDADGKSLPGLHMAGGQKFRLVVWGDVVTANLTSDNESGIGRYSDDDLKRAITRGVKRDSSRMLPFPMGWPAFASLSEQDLNAVVAYLRTIPPVKNAIPPPVRLNPFAYLSAKFQMLILGRDYPMVVFPGNSGSAGNGGGPAPAAAK
jgi:mono/diheme cytochrome c family protein